MLWIIIGFAGFIALLIAITMLSDVYDLLMDRMKRRKLRDDSAEVEQALRLAEPEGARRLDPRAEIDTAIRTEMEKAKEYSVML